MQLNSAEGKVVIILELILDYTRLIISTLILFVGLYFLFDSVYINSGGLRENFHQFLPIHSEKTDRSNFEKLCIDNPDVIAWINIDGIGIDYPVLAGESNEEYLFRNEKKEYSSSGSIFIDSMNSRDFSDFNTLIYGHHMQYGGMFGNLEKFKEKKTFNTIKYGSIYYKKKEHMVEFFAFLDKADGYDFEIYNPGINDEAEKNKYIAYLLNKSKYKRNIQIAKGDRIVLLSTCSQTMTNGRYILVGKFVDYDKRIKNKTIKERRSDSVKVIGKLIILLSLVLIILLILIFIRRRAK